MATIVISDISPVGYDLLFDSESYMTDISNNELDRVVGGTEPVSALVIGAIAFGTVVGAGLAGYGIGTLLK
uniref:Class IIb bacteriocin, lactobin A/cerein 7B family n=1 Tax=Nostoc sp. PCC 9201 TaxID=2099382 RepID=A0A2P0ZGP6_9NOSO|nr:hypothetical protein [Nostoc sp. PCC 9201]